jgi:hypothetical protein
MIPFRYFAAIISDFDHLDSFFSNHLPILRKINSKRPKYSLSNTPERQDLPWKFVGFFRQNGRLPKITRQPSNRDFRLPLNFFVVVLRILHTIGIMHVNVHLISVKCGAGCDPEVGWLISVKSSKQELSRGIFKNV